MDNRAIDITTQGTESLALALQLIWDNAPGGKATHYKVVRLREQTRYYGTPATSHHTELVEAADGTPTLILLWHEERGATALPFPLTRDDAPGFVAGWLKSAEYGREPDHDGSNERGFRVFTDGWGHVAGHHYGIAGVQPVWAMYGK